MIRGAAEASGRVQCLRPLYRALPSILDQGQFVQCVGVVAGVGLGGASVDRRKRSRVFIDPLTEIPRLERWFADDTHPSAYTIEQYTDQLNRAAYRQRFPPLEPKNVQLWFKNHRAKVKRPSWNLEPPSQSQAAETGTLNHRAKVKRQKLELQSTAIMSAHHPAPIACTDR